MKEHRRRSEASSPNSRPAPWPRSANGSSETRLEKFGNDLLKSTRWSEKEKDKDNDKDKWHPKKCPKFCWYPPEEHARKCEWQVCEKNCPSCYYQRSASATAHEAVRAQT